MSPTSYQAAPPRINYFRYLRLAPTALRFRCPPGALPNAETHRCAPYCPPTQARPFVFHRLDVPSRFFCAVCAAMGRLLNVLADETESLGRPWRELARRQAFP